jgi:hypothetical protein
MPYTYHPENPRNHYLIDGAKSFCNKGNFCESVAKFHRGLDYLVNPNTAALDGYDIPTEKAEIKTAAGGLGRKIGDPSFSVSQQIHYYFAHKSADSKWIWVIYDDETHIVTEYHMDKREFGKFLHLALRGKHHLQSNTKNIDVRFNDKNTDMMIDWLESQCVEAA